MIRRFLCSGMRPAGDLARSACYKSHLRPLAAGCALAALWAGAAAAAQVITIDTSGKGPVAANGPVDRRYAQITPTHVALSNSELDAKTRLMLIRALQSEQGFAMRPFPRGHKGLTLEANGKLEPAGEAYLDMATVNGLSAKPGDRLVITNIKIDNSKIILDLNGGPDPKHRFLRHVQIGMGGPYEDPTMGPPVAGDPNEIAAGARLTLAFRGHIPELTEAQVEALLAPMISFNVETPIEAYTSTLPAPLKEAILSHQVLVGMDTDMVMFAKGQPDNKSREMEGQMPFTVWIYGKPPQTVEFVRINGNRVIRVEIAKMGQPLEVFTKDVVSGMMRTDGTPVLTAQTNVHVEEEGDVQRDPNKEAPAAPPTLRKPGEKLPDADNSKNDGAMKPVYFPPDAQGDGTQLGQNPDVQPPASTPAKAQPPADAQTPSAGTQSAPANGAGQPPAAKPPTEQQLTASSGTD